MALNWDIGNVKDYEEKREKDKGNVLDTLIWLTMAVGMNQITEKNYVKFFLRTQTSEIACGAMRSKIVDDKMEPVYVTLEDVKCWIGLHTNAGSLSPKQFEDKLVERLKERYGVEK